MVCASKKGEMLVMRKVGLAPPESAIVVGEKQPELAAIFKGPLDGHYFAIMPDLLPAAQALSDADQPAGEWGQYLLN
nr:unnamed protein product [Digitaria exilis]